MTSQELSRRLQINVARAAALRLQLFRDMDILKTKSEEKDGIYSFPQMRSEVCKIGMRKEFRLEN